MFRSLAVFALLYLLLSLVAYYALPDAVALHFAWCYPLLAAVAAVLARPRMPLRFCFCALPLVYGLNVLRFVFGALWFLGLDMVQAMLGGMLPLVIANLCAQSGLQEAALALLNAALVFAALFAGAWLGRRG